MLAYKGIWRMNIPELTNLAEIAGALAVVASLIFVGFQIRQNTIVNRAGTLQANADYWLHHMTAMMSGENGKLYAKGTTALTDLTNAEFGRFFLLCRATFMGLENQHYQYRIGLMDASAYAGYELTIREQLAAFAGIRAMWKIVKHTYGVEFQEFMDEQISKVTVHSHASVHASWHDLVQQDRQKQSSGDANT